MGYTLYFKTGEARCNEMYRRARHVEDGPLCCLPIRHLGPHIAWIPDNSTQIWWELPDNRSITVDEALRGKKS